jgi:hypothetical protein
MSVAVSSQLLTPLADAVALSQAMPFDAIVVGAGTAGITAARTLAENGHHVLILESGPLALLTHIQTTDLKFDPALIRSVQGALQYSPALASGGAFGSLISCVGGRGMFWNGAAPRFLAQDFAGWPLSLDDLHPYYEWAEVQLDVSTCFATGALGEMVCRLLRRAGLPAEPSPFAVDTRRTRNGWMGGTVGNSVAPLLRSGLLTASDRLLRIVANVFARTIEIDKTAGRATGVAVVDRQTGSTAVLRARSVVLAAGAFESVRLALGSGVPDTSGVMGKLISDHLFCRAYYPLPAAFYDPRLPEATAVLVRPEAARRYQIEVHLPADNLFNLRDQSAWAPAPSGDYAAMVRGFAPIEPRPENFIEVTGKPGPGAFVVHMAYSQSDLALRDSIVSGLDTVRAALGAQNADVQVLPAGASHHEAGGLIMGRDAYASVTDAFGRFHSVDNVVAVDSSTWPDVAPANPHLTIAAISRRQSVQLCKDIRPTGSVRFPSGVAPFTLPKRRAMTVSIKDFGAWIINFDPAHPRASQFGTATEAMTIALQSVQPAAVPWPAEWAPEAEPAPGTPAADAALPQRDVLIVTWTAGEARTLGQLFMSDNFDDWYQYKRNVVDYIPKVTGKRAPFNGDIARYHHSLGLYFPLRIGGVSALAFKSGLHMAHDGPAVPVLDLWRQILAEVRPKLVITTGTGGAIGGDVRLGDVVVAANTRFDLTSGLQDKPYAQSSYAASPLDPARISALVTEALLKPNGDLLEDPGLPTLFYPNGANVNIVSTDFFAFDDTTNHYQLQGLGRCCDMGDATLGLVMDGAAGGGAPATDVAPAWYAIRNASDPQIQNPDKDINRAGAEAHQIYLKYQQVTTAGSLIASWAVVASKFPDRARSGAILQAFATRAAPVEAPPRPADTAESVLLQLASSASVSHRDIAPADLPDGSSRAVKQRLQDENVDYDSSDIAATEIRFTDVRKQQHILYYVSVTNVEAEEFVATYVIFRGTIVAKFEAVSS